MRFANPAFLLLLLLPLVYVVFRRARRANTPHLPYTLRDFAGAIPTTRRARWHRLPARLSVVGFSLFVVALARPQMPSGQEDVKLKSRNIVVVLDISSSMKATDFQPGNRLAVAREVLRNFVLKRDGDLVGVVTFAGRAFLQAPLTSDMPLLHRMLQGSEIGTLPDGTAIGTALAMALNQLKDLPPKASCVVLVTDGANNTGRPTLAEATEMARALGVRVHTIGLSSMDTTSIALNGVWAVRDRAARLTSRDEATLRRLAERTGGRYARASSPDALTEIMAGIDPLERNEVVVKETRTYRELFPFVLALGLLLLFAERGLSATWLRTVP